MTAPEPRVSLPDEARRLRRELGPTAWVALEELVVSARSADGGQLVSRITTVRLAAELGIGRDAAVAALCRLRRHGLVAFEAARQEGTGRFGAGRYVVGTGAAAVVSCLGAHPTSDIPVVVAEGAAARVSPRAGRRVPAVARADGGGEQGSLFELLGNGDGGGGRESDDRGSEFGHERFGGGGETRGHRHELASQMPPGAGDVSGDGRDGVPC